MYSKEVFVLCFVNLVASDEAFMLGDNPVRNGIVLAESTDKVSFSVN